MRELRRVNSVWVGFPMCDRETNTVIKGLALCGSMRLLALARMPLLAVKRKQHLFRNRVVLKIDLSLLITVSSRWFYGVCVCVRL